MVRFHVSSTALVKRGERYLAVEEGKEHVEGTWNIPGGGIEPGENPLEAVRREVKEETGLEVEQINGLIAVLNSYSERDGKPVIVFVFSCDVENREPEPEMGEEVYSAEFITEQEIRSRELRTDILLKAIEMEKDERLKTENFRKYLHPHLEEEPEFR